MAFRLRKSGKADVGSGQCPLCGSARLSLGMIDRVTRTVRHRCLECGYGWRDNEIDLVSAELVARTRREAARAVRR